MSAVNRGSAASCFLIWMPSLSFSCLLALARTSHIMLTGSGKSGHCSLFWAGRLSVFRHCVVGSGCSMYSLYWGVEVNFYFCFTKCFCHERMLNFVKFFYCINWDNCFFFCILLMWYITLINFCLLTHSQIPEIGPTWSWYITLLMYYFDLLVFCPGFLCQYS